MSFDNNSRNMRVEDQVQSREPLRKNRWMMKLDFRDPKIVHVEY